MNTLRSHRRNRTTHLLIAAVTLVAALHAVSQPASRELLNSERIAAKFGSYGVEVLEQSEAVRVSSLFSGAGDSRVCRTFAIVHYAPRMDSVLGQAHAAIVAGGSIGAVFAAQGWEVRKTHLRYEERVASAKLSALMRIEAGTPLAEHVYVLDVVKDGRVFEYAALVEIHHPAYLDAAQLREIYGPADDTARGELVAALLATADDRSR
jgi:hypothetical protein